MPSLPFLFIAALYAVSPLTLTVYPPVSHAPASVRIRVVTERHAANRSLCYGYDGPQFKRSCLELDGAHDRRSFTVFWELRQDGEYEAQAVLTRIEDGRISRYTDQQPFRVVGFSSEP